MRLLTAEYLRGLLHYDPQTGLFRWVSPRCGVTVGAVAGCPNNDGHIVIRIDYKRYFAHRLAWLYMTGEWPQEQIDHEDTNPSNNRWDNLRPANPNQNQWNTARNSTNTSGYKGVSFVQSRGKWRAAIKAHGQRHWLGYFMTPEAAHAAYRDAAHRLHGQFARTS